MARPINVTISLGQNEAAAELHEQVRRHADASDLSMSQVARRALREYLERHADG